MSPEIFFVLVTSSMGTWLGMCTKIDYNAWCSGHALKLSNVRGMFTQPNPRNQAVEISIGNPYIADTQQLEIAIFPHSVELIGEIDTAANGAMSCSQSNTLFQQYLQAIQKWKAALANISIATPADMNKILNTKNVTQLPRK